MQTMGADCATPAAHGSREMPVWGAIFREMERGDPSYVKMRIYNLVRYLETVQVR